MTHRGRLNMLVNVLGIKTRNLFNEFTDMHENKLGTDDVKYHQGFLSDVETENKLVHLMLALNPSHLEIISPVMTGSIQARIDQLNKQSKSNSMILIITLYGDATISGQRVV